MSTMGREISEAELSYGRNERLRFEVDGAVLLELGQQRPKLQIGKSSQ